MCRNLMWAYKIWSSSDQRYFVRFWRAVQPSDDIYKVKEAIRNHVDRDFLKSMCDPIQIPCGQCVECRLANSRDWANRCMLEAQYYKDNYFLTLTYDPEHLPMNNRIDLKTGEVLDLEETGTLVPKDLQDFLKRLRIHWQVFRIIS